MRLALEHSPEQGDREPALLQLRQGASVCPALLREQDACPRASSALLLWLKN